MAKNGDQFAAHADGRPVFTDATNDSGWQAHSYALASGFKRTVSDVTRIDFALLTTRGTLKGVLDRNEVFRAWCRAPMPVSRILVYIRAGISLHEALNVWEPDMNESGEQWLALMTLAALASN